MIRYLPIDMAIEGVGCHAGRVFFFLPFLVSSMQLWALGLQGRNGLFSVFVLARAVWCGGDAFLQCCCDASENDSTESLCVCVASIESLRLCLCLPCVYERDF
jgi:hypothetical protein